jgi:2-polyprenyl-3-methyl-5-hydroxy-6-metoxy-1,4-benzoquinol methylase
MTRLQLLKKKSERQIYIEQVETRARKSAYWDESISVQTQLRIERSLALLDNYHEIKGQSIADLGCGRGLLLRKLMDRGGIITGVDALETPLENVPYQKACLPYTPFSDDLFDGIVLTDVIAEIEPHLHRLTLSELARITKKGGWLLSSTPLDLHSHDPCDHFLFLIETEFETLFLIKSFHRLHLYFSSFIQAPTRFLRATSDPHYRSAQCGKRKGIFRIWFYLNSFQALSFLWKFIALLFRPCQGFIEKNLHFLLICEKLSRIFWGEGGVTDVIVLARKKGI